MLSYFAANPRYGEIEIDNGNYRHHLDPVIDGEKKGKGLIPRDYMTHPVGFYAPHVKAFDIPLIPWDEVAARLQERVARKGQLSDIRMITGPSGGMIPSRDQDGVGYCWCHSGTSAHLLIRAFMGEPYADLSAFSVGCMIKKFRDEGGWGAEGVKFQSEKGIAEAKFWPQRSMSRSNDNPQTWANAALHKYVEYIELDPQDPNYLQQIVTCFLSNYAGIFDYNWWSHSVCGADLVAIDNSGDPKSFKPRIWNSWGDSWSAQGMGTLDYPKAIPDSCLFCRVVRPSPAVS
jgi:hypothetical protein